MDFGAALVFRLLSSASWLSSLLDELESSESESESSLLESPLLDELSSSLAALRLAGAFLAGTAFLAGAAAGLGLAAAFLRIPCAW